MMSCSPPTVSYPSHTHNEQIERQLTVEECNGLSRHTYSLGYSLLSCTAHFISYMRLLFHLQDSLHGQRIPGTAMEFGLSECQGKNSHIQILWAVSVFCFSLILWDVSLVNGLYLGCAIFWARQNKTKLLVWETKRAPRIKRKFQPPEVEWILAMFSENWGE